MTVLYSSLSPNHIPRVAEYRKVAYVANGWDAVRRWDGRTTSAELAGIAGPSQVTGSWAPASGAGNGYTTASGDSTIGVHVFRYRYMDSRTGYVSNPSAEFELKVDSGSEAISFEIEASGSENVIVSTDSKVDTIILEATVVGSDDTGGAAFFEAARGANTAGTTVTFDIADANLEVKVLDWADDGHDVPPIAQNIVSHRERIWLFGQVTHAVGTATFTNGSVDVDEGSTDPDWNTEALGSASGESSIPWLIQLEGDSTAYEIDYYDSGNSKIVLKKAFTGTTSSDAGYKIYSRAHAIWVSNPDYPEGFTPLKFLSGPQNEMSGDLTAGVGHGASMLFYSTNSSYKLAWDRGPLEDPIMIPLSSEYGALNQRVVVKVQGRVFAMDYLGWTEYQGIRPKLISRPIDEIRDLIDYSKSDNFHACFLPEARAIRWWVCYTDDTGNYPKRYVQYDLDSGSWSTGEYYQGISASKLIPTSTGLQVMLGDENGHTWFADQGTCDGCYAVDSHLTAASGCTATVLQVDETLDITNVGLAGCFLYHVESGEAKLISSNTSGAITLTSALSTVPSDGDTFWVGPIPSKLKTKAFSSSRRAEKRRAAKVWLTFDPLSSTRYLQFRIYEDLSTVAQSWGTSRKARKGLVWPGDTTGYPATDWLVDLSDSDGHVWIAIGTEYRRYVELELEILEPDADLQINTIEIQGHGLEEEDS